MSLHCLLPFNRPLLLQNKLSSWGYSIRSCGPGTNKALPHLTPLSSPAPYLIGRHFMGHPSSTTNSKNQPQLNALGHTPPPTREISALGGTKEVSLVWSTSSSTGGGIQVQRHVCGWTNRIPSPEKILSLMCGLCTHIPSLLSSSTRVDSGQHIPRCPKKTSKGSSLIILLLLFCSNRTDQQQWKEYKKFTKGWLLLLGAVVLLLFFGKFTTDSSATVYLPVAPLLLLNRVYLLTTSLDVLNRLLLVLGQRDKCRSW